MFDPEVLPKLKQIINNRAQADKRLLDTITREVRIHFKSVGNITE